MLFTSHVFMLLFLPLTILAFELAKPCFRLWVLSVASLVFYAFSGWQELAAMMVVIAWVQACTYLPQALGKRLRMALIVAGPLSVLVLFRYLNFILNNLNSSAETRAYFSFFLDVAIPAGISFYTFHAMSYGIDVLNGRVKREPSFLKLTTFISFFPQLIAGPIVRYWQIAQQLEELATVKRVRRDLAEAFQYITVGLVYKVMCADLLGKLHKKFVVSADSSGIDSWISVVIYSLQIYYDFYGYSLLAMGLGYIFGVRLPANFDRPYQALNPKDFWRRWHMTLSYWLRDYVYIPLGGNQRRVLCILVVFAGCGFWHGPNWTFLLWGLYHAMLVLGYGVVADRWDRMPQSLQACICFFLVTLGWPLFYLSLPTYAQLLHNLVLPATWGRKVYEIQEILILGIILAWTLVPRRHIAPLWAFGNRLTRSVPGQVALATLATLFFVMSYDFIYFRF
jgi:alginate O-acetyltransferase complex protein AlgI